MKKPRILLCFVVITSLFQSHSAIEEVQCTGVEGSGVCGKKSLKFAESKCEVTRPVQPSDYRNIADTEAECKKRFSGSYSALPNEFGLKVKFVPYQYDHYFFQLELDWENYPYAQGYHVVIISLNKDSSSTTEPKNYAYKCIEGGTNSNTTILLEYSFTRGFGSSDSNHCNDLNKEFEVSVTGMPPLPNDSAWRKTLKWPGNCFDIADETLCGPRTPGTSNISVQTELLPNEISLMSATITWSNPTNTIYNITNYNFLLNSPDHKEFHFNQTSANLRSVILKPLSITSEYDFYLESFQKNVCQFQCTKGSPNPGKYGPLVHKGFSYIPPPPLLSPSPSLLPSFSSVSIAVSPSPITPSTLATSSSYYSSDLPHFTPATITRDMSTSPAYLGDNTGSIFGNYFKEFIGGIVVVVFVIVVFGFVVLAVVIRLKYTRKSARGCDQGEDILNSSEPSGESSASTTRSSTPSSPLSPVSVLSFIYDEEPYCSSASMHPLYFKRPTLLHPGINLVLVIESHRSPEKEIIVNQSFLGSELNQYKDLHVLHYNIASKLTPAQWLMDNMGDASVVICVCNKEFQEEWEGKNKDCSLVNPLRNYVIGSSNRGDSLADKYIAVTHTQDDKRYIPREFYVVRHCLIDRTEELYCIITQTPNRIVK